MIAFDDLYLGEGFDPRITMVAGLLAGRLYTQESTVDALRVAGLRPEDYTLDGRPAKLFWREIVPHAARNRKLGALIEYVVTTDPAFGAELERRLAPLLDHGSWYPCHDPYNCCFFGPGAKTAMIDRVGLRSGLAGLAADDYRVLIVYGARRSGKTHSWRLIEHLRQTGKLTGRKFVRVSTHSWGANTKVTGEMVARDIAELLDLNIRMTEAGTADNGVTGSRGLPESRTRTVLTSLTAKFPQDRALRWIVLDGLDREEAIPAEEAMDVALPLITKVADGELPDTRLVITGFDPLWLQDERAVLVEEIPPVSGDLVRDFLEEAAIHLGHEVGDAELDAYVAEVLSAADGPRGGADGPRGGKDTLLVVKPRLTYIEDAVVRLAQREWGSGGPRVR